MTCATCTSHTFVWPGEKVVLLSFHPGTTIRATLCLPLSAAISVAETAPRHRCHPSLAAMESSDSNFAPTAPMAMEDPHSNSYAGSLPAAGHYLPGNPLPYLAPSATHQPELLLLSWMIATLRTLVTDIQNHPILTDPLPYPSSFTDQQAYRLYLQLRNTLRHLVTITADLCQGISVLQFLPGSPGSPGHYRMDPAARFPPCATTNFLSSPIPPLTRPPTTLPPQHRLITHLTPRARSRSRDRLSTTTTSATHTTRTTSTTTSAADHRSFSDIPTSRSHRSSLHQSLWTATTEQPSGSPSSTWPLHTSLDYTGSSR